MTTCRKTTSQEPKPKPKTNVILTFEIHEKNSVRKYAILADFRYFCNPLSMKRLKKWWKTNVKFRAQKLRYYCMKAKLLQCKSKGIVMQSLGFCHAISLFLVRTGEISPFFLLFFPKQAVFLILNQKKIPTEIPHDFNFCKIV